MDKISRERIAAEAAWKAEVSTNLRHIRKQIDRNVEILDEVRGEVSTLKVRTAGIGAVSGLLAHLVTRFLGAGNG
ncbi:hypothetical protein ACFL1X_03355 [Candidatus Hydrogenedentota bacterium]